ncbi:enoyl-CoA hydratase/isomerase family protein [Bacillus spongiae]|uniref:3-hydroxyisobutyryl-CoA hydrolase n=1 Tax=Bacillus spongiae TaxID=2683610 RepID=A0ABU8HAJ7_9BACI
MTNEVLFSVRSNGVATITLNRPKVLNSLSYEMLSLLRTKLEEWESDDAIQVIVMRGAGTKGFCAGGDIKALYKAQSSQSALEKAERFFEEEYQVDQAIYSYSKPIVALLDGIVMGGGVGLTYGSSYRIVTERTKWAMPEMNIGFFPDVGGAYFLNRAPGHIGRYLALTASVIQAPDVLYINGADSYMLSAHLEAFIAKIEATDWQSKSVEHRLQELVEEYSCTPSEKAVLSPIQSEIDSHFSFNTMEEIIESLAHDSSEFASKTKRLLLSKSPASLKITLKQLTNGVDKTVEECFATDLVLAKKFLKHNDFYEGIRSILIDKDQAPQYVYQQLSDVPDEMVQQFFHLKRSQDISK